MYFKRSKQGNEWIYLSIAEGFRVSGKVKSRTIEKCGYLDELEKLHNDPIAHFTSRALELTQAKARESEPVVLEFSPKEKINMRSENAKCLGHAVLSHYYHKLELDTFWKNRRSHVNFSYDPNSIFKLLTYSRITDPGSKAQIYRGEDTFVDKMDFSPDDMYRCLSFLSGHERDLVDWIDKSVRSFHRRDATLIYYDVTSYYFETKSEDELRRRDVSKEHRTYDRHLDEEKHLPVWISNTPQRQARKTL